MQAKQLLFNITEFDRFFPFYILLNENLEIESYGSSLQKLLIGKKDNLFTECFRVSSPEIDLVTFTSLEAVCGQRIIVEVNSNSKVKLKGQLELIESGNQFLFIGSPLLDNESQINESILTHSGFSSQDPLIDLKDAFKRQEIANIDLKIRLEAVNLDKKNQQKDVEENRDIALFPIQSPDPLFRIRVDGRILFSNPVADTLTEFYYQNSIYNSADLWKIIAKQGNYIYDKWSFNVVSNNNTYAFFCRYLPEKNYFNAYGRDITQQKKNEEELLRLSVVASANESGVLFNDATGKILWVNEGFCKMIGFAFDEIIGKSALDFCKGSLTDDSVLQNIASSMGHTQYFNEELIHYRKDGSWFWARVKGQSYQSGETKELQYFAIVENITDVKGKEEQLKILSQIAESNINAVIITDKSGRITWINKSFTEMTGYTLEEASGEKPGHLLQGPATDKKTIAYLKKQIEEGQPFNTEIYNYSKTGKPYWLRIQGQPIYNIAGELSGFFALEENITKEKEIQQLIKGSETRLRTTLEKIGDNVWEHDFSTGATKFSKSNNQLWGYTASTVIDDGKLWWDRVYADDLHLFKENYLKYQKGKIDSHNLEYRIVHQDGSIKWVMDRGAVIEKDEEGKPLKLVGTHTDITHIKRTEAELEQRLKQFKSLSENIPGVIYEYEFRADGTEGLRYVSPAMETVFGIKPSEFQNYLSFIDPADHERIIEKNEHSKKTLEPFYDESWLIISGVATKWHSVHSAFSYISETGAKVFTGFMMDITERKNREQTLLANEEKYRSILANMKLGLLEVDTSGIITYANNSFCEMSGYGFAELLGNGAAPIFLTENPGLEEEKREKRRKGIADAYEIETKDKNGNKKWWLISGAPSYNDKGELVGSIGIHLDITEQKKQERELVTARVQAEQLAHTKETFLANMSHEIRTPMNAIMGMSNQLAKTSLLPQQQFYLETIHSASESLLVIINDILDLSKIEAGKLSFENIGFELPIVLRSVLQVVSHKAEEKGLHLNSICVDDTISPVLIGDPHRINQVLLNLMTNAIKFTEKGSVDLSCKLITDGAISQVIQVQVKDTGIGMEESFVKVLFDKFSQEYESVSRQFGGTGLGMSICKELIELMGGEIHVESKKGYGTVISFTIELKKGTNADLPEKYINQFSPNFLLGKKILVTDDNELNRLVATIILQNYEATVMVAENGEVAIEMIEKENFDIVLMDIQMPVLNGLNATTILRKNGQSLPIIALTAAAIKGEREKCIDAGMNDYITKPFKEDVFLKTIDKWLKEKPNLEKNKKQMIMDPEILYDLSALKEIGRGNDSFIKKMVDIFCEHTPQMIKEMTEAYYNNDLEAMGAAAHKMKPSIDSLNITYLKPIIRQIESLGRENQENAELPEFIKETERFLTKVMNMMKMEYPTQTER